MADKNCEKCGSDLFIKAILEDSYEYFCPCCLNLNLINKTESLDVCKKYIDLTELRSLNYCQKFSKEDLIYISLNLREMAIKEWPDVINIKIEEILWAILI